MAADSCDQEAHDRLGFPPIVNFELSEISQYYLQFGLETKSTNGTCQELNFHHLNMAKCMHRGSCHWFTFVICLSPYVELQPATSRDYPLINTWQLECFFNSSPEFVYSTSSRL